MPAPGAGGSSSVYLSPSLASLRPPWEARYRVEANLMESPIVGTRRQGVLSNVAFFYGMRFALQKFYITLSLAVFAPTHSQIYRQKIGPGGNKLPKEHSVR